MKKLREHKDYDLSEVARAILYNVQYIHGGSKRVIAGFYK